MHYAASMLKVLLFTITIPALGFIVSFWILSDVDGDLMSDGLPGYQQICANEQALKSPEVRGACTEWQTIEWLGHVSIIAAALGILIPVVFWLASLMAGASRSRIAVIFPPLVLWSLITISISVLLQGGIFTYGAYIAEAYAFERVHYFIIFAIGIGALVAAVKLIMVSFTFGKPLTTVPSASRFLRAPARVCFPSSTGWLKAQGPKRRTISSSAWSRRSMSPAATSRFRAWSSRSRVRVCIFRRR